MSFQLKIFREGNDFETFWSAYPRKHKKGDAYKAWGQVRHHRPPVEEIIRVVGLMKQTDQWREDSGRYVPLPATWLRAWGWCDEPEVEVEESVDPWAGYNQEMDIGGWEYSRRLRLMQGGKQ